jgi:hypothetical protein
MNYLRNKHFDLFQKGTATAPEPSDEYLLSGFTSEQLWGLFQLKSAVAKGRYSETTPEFRRLMFARWLVEHGRLEG